MKRHPGSLHRSVGDGAAVRDPFRDVKLKRTAFYLTEWVPDTRFFATLEADSGMTPRETTLGAKNGETAWTPA
jgi:hypothetical protein